MRAPRVKPVLRDSRKAIEKISELIQETSDNESIITMRESDLKQLIVNVIVELDANYVRKADLKREVELALQEMIKGQIAPGGR